jgi:hypothetical protein
MADDLAVQDTEREAALAEASRIIARAQADAEAIRREALVTAEGIRQIALEDARSLDLPGTMPRDAPDAGAAEVDVVLGDLLDRVERIERKLKRQRRQIERVEAVLLGLAPGLSHDRRRKKR